MSATLERMGDLARHIAEIARGRYPRNAVPQSLTGTFAEMDAASRRLTQRIVTLLASRDLALAEQVEADDDRLDDLHADTFTAMLGGGWTATPQQTVDVTLLGRFYERFGDHGVSIARRVVYLVTGDLSAGEPLHIHG
jgi:phosphate transport system protein